MSTILRWIDHRTNCVEVGLPRPGKHIFYQMYLNTTAIDEAKSAAYGKVDFLSNGFKPRVAGQGVNSATVYFYMAWAAEPFHNLYGGQANAR